MCWFVGQVFEKTETYHLCSLMFVAFFLFVFLFQLPSVLLGISRLILCLTYC